MLFVKAEKADKKICMREIEQGKSKLININSYRKFVFE